MLPEVVEELLRLYPRQEDLVSTLAVLTGQDGSVTERELHEHLAARIAFLLIGETAGADSFPTIAGRLARRLKVDPARAHGFAEVLARAVVFLDAAEAGSRSSLRDLPYPQRRAMLLRQGGRCGVCGWQFGSQEAPQRATADGAATLDHRVPHRLGGDHDQNLWILCGLCNTIKQAAIHVGEHGRVWTNNYVYGLNPRRVAFWVMRRDRSCAFSGCGLRPDKARLFVVKKSTSGPWVVDNCVAVCAEHKHGDDALEY
jgi:HNH endonuclease